MWITGSHLNLVGNVTPAVRVQLQLRDIEDGFMARFAIIAPEERPPFMPRTNMLDDVHERNELQGMLHRINTGTSRAVKQREDRPSTAPPLIKVEPAALVELDNFQREIYEKIEDDDNAAIMLKRVGDMADKVTMLCAAADNDGQTPTVTILKHHADWGIGIAKKWGAWGVQFANVIARSELERNIEKVIRFIRTRGHDKVPRTAVTRSLHLSKWEVDQLMMTMMDRGLLKIDVSGKKEWWIIGDPDEEKEPEREPGEEG